MMRAPIVMLLLSYMVGIILAGQWEVPITVLLLLEATAIVLGLLWVHNHPYRSRIALCAAFFILGCLRFEQVDMLPATDISHIAQSQLMRVTGTIVEYPELHWENERRKVIYLVRVDQAVTEQGTVIPVSGMIRITVNQLADARVWHHGDRMLATGALRPISVATNPGSPNFQEIFRRRGITAVMQLRGTQSLQLIGHSPVMPPILFVEQLRTKMEEYFTGRFSREHNALLQGLLFGYSGNISDQTMQQFSDTGVIHILSVSGFHIALLATLFCSLNRQRPWIGLPLSLTVVIGYVLLSGCSPPAVRSAIMYALAVGGEYSGRGKNGVHGLTVAALIMLLYQPQWLYDVGFQLSFMATGGLVVLYPLVNARINMKPRWLWQSLAVTGCAQLAVVPLLAHYFNSISLSSFLANLLISWPVAAAIVLGLACGILGQLIPIVCIPFNWLNELCLNGVLISVRLCAAIPYSKLFLPDIPLLGSLLYYAGVIWLAGMIDRWVPTPAQLLATNLRRYVAGIIIGMVLIVMTVWSNRETSFTATVLDVGSGHCVYIETPQHHHLLIGAGLPVAASHYNPAVKIVMPFLQHNSVSKLDVAVADSPQAVFGIMDVAKKLPVDLLLMPMPQAENAGSEFPGAVNGRVTRCLWAAQEQTITVDGVTLTVWYLPPDQVSNPQDYGMIVQCRYRQFSLLLAPRISRQQQRDVQHDNRELDSQVVLWSPHGELRDDSREWLEQIQPQVVIVQNGHGKRQQVSTDFVEFLQQRGCRFYTTAEHGAVMIQSDGNTFTVSSMIKETNAQKGL